MNHKNNLRKKCELKQSEKFNTKRKKFNQFLPTQQSSLDIGIEGSIKYGRNSIRLKFKFGTKFNRV